MSDPDEIRLRHMLDAAELAAGFAAGRQRSDLDDDPMLLHASVNCLLIIGEAATRVSVAVREQQPQIPWTQVVGMRHRLVHVYFEIDRSIVWDTLTINLPALIAQLQQALQPHDEEE